MAKNDLTKEELMQQVLGKKRGFDLLRNHADEISRKMGEIGNQPDESRELLRTLYKNQQTLKELSEEVNLDDLKADIAKDFGIQDTLFTEKLRSFDAAAVNASSKAALNGNADSALRSRAEWKKVDSHDVPKMFNRLVGTISESVKGQERAVKEIVEGLLRPYVQEATSEGLRNTVYISGSKGSGRHYLFERTLAGIQGVLIDDVSYTELDMADYQESTKETVFLQDMYSALSNAKPFILIHHYEFSHITVSHMLGELIKDGKISLSKRYVEKNGVLQESEKTLQTEFLKELKGNGKLIFFISDRKKSDFANVFGKTVADSVLDYVATERFTKEIALHLVHLQLDALKKELEAVTKASVDIDGSVASTLHSLYDPFNGVHSFIDRIKEIKLKICDESVERIGQDVKLFYDGGFKAKYLDGIVSLSSDDDELEHVKEEIRDIVGLEEVKAYLMSMEDLVKAGGVRRKMGLKSDAVTRHMIFTGNPGTGKTTIARIVSKLMKAIGALNQGHLVEVTRADLVGRYVGHTAPLTTNVIRSALGGVLFIDEAYSLYRGKDDSFGLEAIDTLVKGMEDNRENLMVILAGYSDEMRYFLTSNSGLASRFPKTVHFEDYCAEDLIKIAVSVAQKKDYLIEEAALESLRRYLGEENRKQKSNGRLARNVVEAAIIKQSGRIGIDSDVEEMKMLRLEDFDLIQTE